MIMRQSDGIIAPMFKVFVVTKGQIISKGLFGATVFDQKPYEIFLRISALASKKR